MENQLNRDASVTLSVGQILKYRTPSPTEPGHYISGSRKVPSGIDDAALRSQIPAGGEFVAIFRAFIVTTKVDGRSAWKACRERPGAYELAKQRRESLQERGYRVRWVGLDGQEAFFDPIATALTPERIRHEFLARLDAAGEATGPYWAELRADIEALGEDAFARAGEGGTLLQNLFVFSGGGRPKRRVPSLGDIYHDWAAPLEATRLRAEEEALHANECEVRYYRGDAKLGKLEWIPASDAMRPWKEGHAVVTENARVEGRNFDSNVGANFVVRSTNVGTDIDEGTVVAKRQIILERLKTQYLVKPRSVKAERVYQARKRLAEIESRFAYDSDMPAAMSAELEAERAVLLAELAAGT